MFQDVFVGISVPAWITLRRDAWRISDEDPLGTAGPLACVGRLVLLLPLAGRTRRTLSGWLLRYAGGSGETQKGRDFAIRNVSQTRFSLYPALAIALPAQLPTYFSDVSLVSGQLSDSYCIEDHSETFQMATE